MSAERTQGDDAKKVPDEEARRLLVRATEIESAQSGQLSMSELREVAFEAGIAPNAFDQAVVELEAGHPTAAAEPLQPVKTTRSRFLTLLKESARTAAVVVVILLILMVMVDLL